MNESDARHLAARARPGQGVGAALRRKEDGRFLLAGGLYRPPMALFDAAG